MCESSQKIYVSLNWLTLQRITRYFPCDGVRIDFKLSTKPKSDLVKRSNLPFKPRMKHTPTITSLTGRQKWHSPYQLPATKMNKQGFNAEGNGTIAYKKKHVRRFRTGNHRRFKVYLCIYHKSTSASPNDNKLDHLLWTFRQIRQSNN